MRITLPTVIRTINKRINSQLNDQEEHTLSMHDTKSVHKRAILSTRVEEIESEIKFLRKVLTLLRNVK